MVPDLSISQEPSFASEPYDPRYFADRRPELRQIRRKVEEGLAGCPITQPVVHVWGLRGTGKSWLLSHLKATYAFAPGKGFKKEGTLCALIDFSALRLTLWELPTVVRLFVHIVDEVQVQLGERAEKAAEEIEAFQRESRAFQESGGIREVTRLAERLVALINCLSMTFVPMLLFDAAETLTEEDFFWLESHLIEPIARTDRVIFIVAGRKEIPRWLEFGVRQRLAVWELEEFDKEGTREQLDRRGYGYLGEVVYSLSFGHPYANQVLGTALDRLADKRPVDKDFAEAHRPEVVVLLGEIENQLLSEVKSATHRDVLRVLSVLRKFNIESARHMLGRFLRSEPDYKQQSDVFYLRLFEDLEDTNLAWWSKDQRGYAVAPVLRRIIDLHSRKRSPTEFNERHIEALRLYESWMKKYPYDCGGFLTEALFQLANTLLGKETAKVQGQVDTFLRQALVTECFTTDSANALFQSVHRDPELQDPAGVMPRSVYEHVIQRIRDFRNKIAEDEPAEGIQNEQRVQAGFISARPIR